MRIGAFLDTGVAGAVYRGIDPLNAMAARGHEIVSVETVDGIVDASAFNRCDVVHVYRYQVPVAHQLARHFRTRGIGVVWDNDDDFSVFPEDSQVFDPAEMRQRFAWSVEMAGLAHRVTVTTDALARRYREAGIERIEVIPNAVTDVPRRRRPHEGLVVGWVAGVEHHLDAERLGIAEALRALQEHHPSVRVECIGLDLGLQERYRHTLFVPFPQLPIRMGSFDIGLAPLADIPFNHARSDIKVKEYAASSVPWLASRLTPYAELGPDQGGLLVDDDGWLEALDRLVRDAEERERLARSGSAWAARHSIASTADRWEQVYRDAVSSVGGGRRRSATSR